ncbi:MAG: CSLREA domain-containing protein, partial [Acidobacteriota bacterium]
MAQFVVTTLDDVVDESDGVLSLREAIALANDQAGTDEIVFDQALAGGLLRLTQGELEITDAVTIDGEDRDITITGDALGNDILEPGTDITDVMASRDADVLGDNSRIFNITEIRATTNLVGLTLTGGYTGTSNSGFYDDTHSGGAIKSVWTVTLLDSSVAGNATGGDHARGGAIHAKRIVELEDSEISMNSTFGDNAQGGAIFVYGGLDAESSAIAENSTFGFNSDGGGAFASYIRLLETDVTNNATHGDGSSGGGLYSFGRVVLVSSQISENSASGRNSSGGGIGRASEIE